MTERAGASLGRGRLTEGRAAEAPRLHARRRHVGVDDRPVLLAVGVDGARARGQGREQREQENGEETHREGEPVQRLYRTRRRNLKKWPCFRRVGSVTRALHAPAVRLPGARRWRGRPVVRARGGRTGLGGRAHQAEPLREQHHVRARGSGRGALRARQLRAARRGHRRRRGGSEQPRGGVGHGARGPGAHPRADGAGRTFRTQPNGEFDLSREGGHTRRRIVHAGDITGREISARCSPPATTAPNIPFFPDSAAIDLILDRAEPPRTGRAASAPTCCCPTGKIETFLGQRDGAGHRRRGQGLPVHDATPTSRPATAWRWRTGPAPRIANMEFYQFHPTCLYHPRGEELPHQRGAARRGRQAAAAQRRAVHGALPPDAASSLRATSWRAPSTPR